MRLVTLIGIALFILLSGCSSKDINFNNSINYNLKEPYNFPFEVNEVYSEVEIPDPAYLHQFIFHYKNKQTGQELKYIMSKVIKEELDAEKNFEVGKQHNILANGKSVYYSEDETSQSLWWESEDGFLVRYVYFVNEKRDNLGDYKLEQSDLIELANQVQ